LTARGAEGESVGKRGAALEAVFIDLVAELAGKIEKAFACFGHFMAVRLVYKLVCGTAREFACLRLIEGSVRISSQYVFAQGCQEHQHLAFTPYESTCQEVPTCFRYSINN
jgi:hypothetical protein